MIRREKFVMAHKPYAIDLTTVSGAQKERDGRFFFRGSCRAVWFRRKDRVTRACLGSLHLWAHYLTDRVDMSSPEAVLSADLDGRYGGQMEGRWDGSRYFGAQEPRLIQRDLEILSPMLENFPQVPEGFSGWWSFR